jgi:hypothetical protein
MAGGATEHVEVTYVPSGNMNADGFGKRGATFSTQALTPVKQCQQI